MSKEHDNNGDNKSTPPHSTRYELKCMGEFPLFPGWLFFERLDKNEQYHINAFGSEGRKIRHVSENREFSIAECLRKILSN